MCSFSGFFVVVHFLDLIYEIPMNSRNSCCRQGHSSHCRKLMSGKKHKYFLIFLNISDVWKKHKYFLIFSLLFHLSVVSLGITVGSVLEKNIFCKKCMFMITSFQEAAYSYPQTDYTQVKEEREHLVIFTLFSRHQKY